MQAAAAEQCSKAAVSSEATPCHSLGILTVKSLNMLKISLASDFDSP